MAPTRLSEFFTSRQIITQADWDRREALCASEKKNILRELIAERTISQEQAHEAVAYSRGWKYQNLKVLDVPEEIIDLVPSAMGRDNLVLPVALEDGRLTVATTTPNNLTLEKLLQGAAGHPVELVYSPKDALERAVSHYYSMQADAAKKGARAAASVALETGTAALTVARDEGEIVDVLNTIIRGGIAAGASDIHLEPEEARLRVRYSIDGVPQEQTPQPAAISPRIAALIKTLAKLNSSDLKNQDGVISHYFENRSYDLRVAVLPAQYGQSITLRLASEEIRDLADAGFTPENEELYRRALGEPSGAIFNVGPMGSGKTSLNMSGVAELRQQGLKIVSLEDPVEVRMPWGITQVSVNKDQEMDWEDAMPTILRSAARALFIGEVNKKAIAHLAVEAALTGHLVLSTLHTIDAPGSIVRLREFGIRPSVLADSMRLVVAQRLPRRLCECKVPMMPTRWNIRDFQLTDAQINAVDPETGRSVWYGARPGGCDRCNHIGYKGRLPIHELMTFPRVIRDMITDDLPNRVIAEKARELGMRPLREDGRDRAMQGLTSLDEVRRHIIVD